MSNMYPITIEEISNISGVETERLQNMEFLLLNLLKNMLKKIILRDLTK